MQTLWLVRHAHRLDFIEPEWFDTAIHRYDPPLSPAGVKRSHDLASELSHIPIDRLFSSPFLRAIQTAAPLARLLELPIQLEWGLCEWLCQDWSSELPQTTPVEELIKFYPSIDANYQSSILPCYPETSAQLNIRTHIIARKLVQCNCKNVVTVAHKGSILGIVAALTGEAKWQTYDLACGEMIKLVGDGEIWSGIVEG
ncbi:histidine phosphatase family protein [Chamaesiphon sp.]|uniref:histidine phosphatase family protein n=1 Tax=Chamaesiphon sp. TaxID=2814140 RepID=UPI003593ECE7